MDHHHTSNTTYWQPTSSVSTPTVPTEPIWVTQTQYSNREKYVDPLFESSALAVKCERVFHATVNDILGGPLSETQKKKCLERYNNEMEAFAAEILYEIRRAEYLEKHGSTEATEKSSGDNIINPRPMPSITYINPTESNEEKHKRKKGEKEMLIQILGREKASELRRKWKKEKHETKKRKKRANELTGADSH